jgi:23S rRNA (cytosine1962-C5)-methyltransferase
LTADGYVCLEGLLPIPEDVAGYPGTQKASLPASPLPFNHPTKIALLRVTRKDGKRP